MAKRIFEWKDKNCNDIKPEWNEINYIKLIEIERNQRKIPIEKRRYFLIEPQIEKYDDEYIFECTYEKYLQYRRTTCMSHGVKRVYWRCLNRIENKDKYCKDSVGVEECKLHDAICRAISSAIPEKGEILSAIKSTLEYAETGDENSLNIFNFEQNIATKKEEAKRIMLIMSTTEGDTEKYEKAISKIYDEIRVLREELDIARKRFDSNTDLTSEIKRLTEIFERDDLSFKEFDDRVIRRITECIRVMGDKSIIITLKGGFELIEKI